MGVDRVEDHEWRPLTREEWKAFYERWVRELPEKRQRSAAARERLRRIAEGRSLK